MAKELLIFAPNQDGFGTQGYWRSFERLLRPKELDGMSQMRVVPTLDEVMHRVEKGQVGRLLAGVEYAGQGRIAVKSLLAFLSSTFPGGSGMPDVMLVHDTDMPNSVVLADLKKGTGVFMDFTLAEIKKDCKEISDFLMAGWESSAAGAFLAMVPTEAERRRELAALPEEELVKTYAVREVFLWFKELVKETGWNLGVGYKHLLQKIEKRRYEVGLETVKLTDSRTTLISEILGLEKNAGLLAV